MMKVTKVRLNLSHIFTIFQSIIFFVISPFLFSQSYLIHTYQSSDGLISPEVYAVLQDELGRLWIGTRGGISVYDGFSWESFTVANGLPGNSVQAMDIDEQNRIWALVEFPGKSICYFENGVWKEFSTDNIFPDKVRFTQLKITGKGNDLLIVVGTKNDGLYLFKKGKWDHYKSFPGAEKNWITGLAFYQGNLYVATDGGLFLLIDNQLDDTLTKRFPLFSQGIRGIAPEKREGVSRLWLAGSNWIGVLEGNEFKLIKKPVSFPVDESFPYLVLCPDERGGVYFGNPNGLFHLVPQQNKVIYLGRESGLVTEGATALCFDREKNLWIGSLRGLNKLVSERFANYNKNHGLLEDEVTAIQELKPGWLIFGHQQGLTYFKDGKFSTIPFKQAFFSEFRVVDLHKDSQGNVWVAASDLGLGVIDQAGRLRWVSQGKGLRGRVYSVIEDGQKRLWVATSAGLFTYRGGLFQEVASEKFRNLYLRKLFLRPSGEPVVVTSSAGYFRLEGKRWVHYESIDNPLVNNIFAYLEDPQGGVWVGALGGLFQVREGKFYPVDLNGQKIDHSVYLLLRDKKGDFWIGTNRGVYHWNKQHILYYDQSLGLAGDEINRSAGLIDSQGNLWLGTNNGVSCYQPEEDISPDKIPPPQVRLVNIEVSHKVYSPLHPLSLGYDEDDPVFNFLVISFLDEKKIKYRTRLLGFDPEWSEVRPLKVLSEKYTSLPSGKYVFQIQAQNALGRWSQVVSSPPIVIHRAFWATWWFIVLLALLVIGVYYVLFQAVTSRRYAQKLKVLVEARTNQLARSLQEKEALLQEIHHRVKNNLQVISSLLYLQSKKIKDEQDRAVFEESRHRIQAMALTHEILYSSERLGQVSAADYFQRIVTTLLRTYSESSKRVRSEVKVDQLDLSLDEALPCGLIVNELVSNALKHAFPGPREGKIKIKCFQEPVPGSQGKVQVVLVVEDDGVGLSQDFELDNNLGLGLKMVRNLVRQLDGKMEIKRGRGTAFIIRFPHGQSSPHN